MEQFITTVKTDLNDMLKMTQIYDGLMMTGDNLANRIIVELYRGANKVLIDSEDTIVGYVIRSDGYTLDIEGSVEEGKAIVDIPALAYAVEGQISIAIRLFTGDKKIVIAALNYYVRNTSTNAIIDVGHHIPDVQELLSYLDELDQERESIASEEAARVLAESSRASAETSRDTAEQARAQAETERDTAEELRDTAELTRIANESTRDSAETDRNSAEATRISNESVRVQSETTRNTAEQGRAQAETARDTAEQARAAAETTRDTAEAIRIANETARDTAEQGRDQAETARDTAEQARAAAELERESAEHDREDAEDTRAEEHTAAINKINNMTVDSERLSYDISPSAVLSQVNGHYHIRFGLPVGAPFKIAKTFASIEAMNAYTGTDVEYGDFVVIASNVDEEDNGKLYIKTEDSYQFIVDLSGRRGFPGVGGVILTYDSEDDCIHFGAY